MVILRQEILKYEIFVKKKFILLINWKRLSNGINTSFKFDVNFRGAKNCFSESYIYGNVSFQVSLKFKGGIY